MTRVTGEKVVCAVARAFHQMKLLADTNEKTRELAILTQLTYLELHAFNAEVSSAFVEEMARLGGAGDEPLPDGLIRAEDM